MLGLRDCTPNEQMILVAMASLASQLPRELASYTMALIEINRNYFGPVPKPGVHNPSPGSLAQTRTVRAGKRFGS